MAKVTWPHTEAKRLGKRLKDTNRTVVFETGYGPSGLPHIGTFAEVARTTFMMHAFRHAFPQKKTRLIVFSDDMDGLRSLPENIPNHTMLSQHLGKPLSSIPDPFAREKNFAAYMNAQLQNFLEYYGFEYEFLSSTSCYQQGMFDEGLRHIMDQYEAIRALFIASISKDKRANWSPFFPLCEHCGKLYTTRVTAVDPSAYQLSYVCDQADALYQPCGHSATTEITGGRVKVGWKVDWALRWYTFGVDYEMYGKDLMDSASMSSKICALLGGKPPVTYKYELFLDEEGAKISKKIGNGISMEQWQAYAPLGGLLHFLLENPNKARRMGLPILPKIVDDYLHALRTEDRTLPERHLWFVDAILHHHDAGSLRDTDVGFALLVNVAANLGLQDSLILYKYASRYDPGVQQNEPFFMELCEKAIAYVQGFESQQDTPRPKVDSTLIPYLAELRTAIQALAEQDQFEGAQLQNALFSVARNHDIPPKEWFAFLYAALLGKEQGPRMGTFFAVLGLERVLAMMDKAM